jgi:uncharacterized phage protein (TIGR02220 family)
MDFLLFIKDLRLKNKVYCEVWLNILMQYNDEDTKTINIYPSLDIQQRTFYRIIDYGIKSFNENLKNYKIQKQRSRITIQKVVFIKQEKPKNKKVVKFEQVVKPKIIENNIYTEIIQYLNESAGKNFKSNTKIYKDKIDARISEGYVLEDFKKVIEIKCKKWLNTKMADYLTPTTLFGDKFVNYVNENPTKTKIQKSYEAIAKSTELGWNNNTNN